MDYQKGYVTLFHEITDLLDKLEHKAEEGCGTIPLEDMRFYLKIAQARAEESILQSKNPRGQR